jgi:hypothetical protein
MALISGLFALVGRFAGRLLNTSLGWATLLLFGKVSGRRQALVLLIALAALVWVIVLIGVLIPPVAVFLLAAVPLPAFVDQTWIRLGMLVAAALIPILVGVAALLVAGADRRPKGARGVLLGVLRGYPFTLLLAVTVGFLAAVSIIRKVTSLARRHEDAHVPLIVQPGGYDAVLEDLEAVLDASGIDVTRAPAPAILSIPPRLLGAVAGPSLGGLVPDRLMLLRAAGLEILVYPSDLAISGTKTLVARSRAVIAAKLTESPAYMATTAEAERVEDDIRALAGGVTAAAEGRGEMPRLELQARLDELDRQLVGLSIDFDEWETLYRERLQVERNLLAIEVRGGRGDEGPAAPPAEVALGIVGIALVVVDVVLLVVNRLVPGRRQARR